MVFVNKKGFPNDFIMYLPSLYSCEVINITICIEIVNGKKQAFKKCHWDESLICEIQAINIIQRTPK